MSVFCCDDSVLLLSLVTWHSSLFVFCVDGSVVCVCVWLVSFLFFVWFDFRRSVSDKKWKTLKWLKKKIGRVLWNEKEQKRKQEKKSENTKTQEKQTKQRHNKTK